MFGTKVNLLLGIVLGAMLVMLYELGDGSKPNLQDNARQYQQVQQVESE